MLYHWVLAQYFLSIIEDLIKAVHIKPNILVITRVDVLDLSSQYQVIISIHKYVLYVSIMIN